MLLAKTREQIMFKGSGWKSISYDTIRKRQKNRCFYCNECFALGKQRQETKDHLFPKHLGFKMIGNTVLACYACNQRKGDRLPTLAEILKAWHVVYKDSPRTFICEIRNNKPVFRVDKSWTYALEFYDYHKGQPRSRRIMKNEKPVLALYN